MRPPPAPHRQAPRPPRRRGRSRRSAAASTGVPSSAFPRLRGVTSHPLANPLTSCRVPTEPSLTVASQPAFALWLSTNQNGFPSVRTSRPYESGLESTTRTFAARLCERRAQHRRRRRLAVDPGGQDEAIDVEAGIEAGCRAHAVAPRVQRDATPEHGSIARPEPRLRRRYRRAAAEVGAPLTCSRSLRHAVDSELVADGAGTPTRPTSAIPTGASILRLSACNPRELGPHRVDQQAEPLACERIERDGHGCASFPAACRREAEGS